jgi:hypothetical protein
MYQSPEAQGASGSEKGIMAQANQNICCFLPAILYNKKFPKRMRKKLRFVSG